MSLAILFHFLCAHHVSDINMSIIRSLRLLCWITTLVVFLVRCVLEFQCGCVGVVYTDTTPTQPLWNSNTHWSKNNKTNVVIQQNSRKLLMMDILMSETCWAHKKWNKIASDITLVFYSSSNSTCFGQFLCPSSGVFHCTHSNGICHTGLLTAASRIRTKPVLSWSCLQAVWHIPLLCVQWKTPDDGQRNCLKHVELYSKIYLRN